MKKSGLLLVLITCLFLCVFSCRKGGTSWDTDITAPLFKTTFGIDKLISDTLLTARPDSSLLLVYHNSIYNFTPSSLVRIPDTTIQNNYHWPLGSHLFNPGDAITPGPPANATQTSYSLNGVGLKSTRLRSGRMAIRITNQVKERIIVNYQIPSAKLNGVPFSITFPVPAGVSVSNPGVYNASYDLTGYDIDMTGTQQNSINTVVTVINATVDPAALAPVLVYSTDNLDIYSSFQSIVPEYAKGYFGQTQQLIGPAETTFRVFNKITSGSLLLQTVQLNFNIENSIGVDARIQVSDLYSKNSRTGNTVHLTAPIINTPININRAIETFSYPPVTPSQYSSILNNSNSNAKALIENLPDKFGYQLSISPNPLGNVSGYNDFIFFNYGLKANLDLQVPLTLLANNLTIADTLPVNFDQVTSNVNKLHNAVLTLYAGNGFPLTAGIQLFMMDQNNVIKDSVMAGLNTIDAAPLDANFKAIGQRQTILVIPVDENKIKTLIRSKKIMIIVRFNTSSKPQLLKIYSGYKMDFKLTGDFNYTIKLN